MYVYPDKLLGKGRDRLKQLFASMFEEGSVRVEVHHQLVADGYVVNETTTFFGTRKETGISIYEVRAGLIQSVRLVRDAIRAKQEPVRGGG